jgi:outer membrane protein OmpA-like peptidoglycan-associated protein
MTRSASALAALLALSACASMGLGGGSGEAERGELMASPPPQDEPVSSPSAAPGYLETQAGELDAIAGAEVQRREDSLLVSLPSSALFENGEHVLAPGALDQLGSLARTLKTYPRSRVIIKGHTDSTGDGRFNQTLSEQRAESVRALLIAEGVAHDRISAIGFGAQMPVATNNTPEGRDRNRRVEIEIRPDEGILSEASRRP